MEQTLQEDQFEFAQQVRKTCHKLNNILTVLRCQQEDLGSLPSENIETELVGALKNLDSLVDEAASQIVELSQKCNTVLEGTKNQ